MKKAFVLLMSMVMVLGLALTACQPQTIVQTVEVEKTVVVEKEVEKTVVVEVEKPAEVAEAPQVAPGELRIALLLDGPINDQGWNQGAYDGLAAVKNQISGRCSLQRKCCPCRYGSRCHRLCSPWLQYCLCSRR